MIFALLGCALLGFLGGLFGFKAKSRWCPTCGASLQCVDCLRRAGVYPTSGTR